MCRGPTAAFLFRSALFLLHSTPLGSHPAAVHSHPSPPLVLLCGTVKLWHWVRRKIRHAASVSLWTRWRMEVMCPDDNKTGQVNSLYQNTALEASVSLVSRLYYESYVWVERSFHSCLGKNMSHNVWDDSLQPFKAWHEFQHLFDLDCLLDFLENAGCRTLLKFFKNPAVIAKAWLQFCLNSPKPNSKSMVISVWILTDGMGSMGEHWKFPSWFSIVAGSKYCRTYVLSF